MITSPESAVRHLQKFLDKVGSDLEFKRRFSRNPGAELENLGFMPGLVPSTLPVQGNEQEIAANESVLLEFLAANAEGQAPPVPPLEFRLVAYGVRDLALLYCREGEALALAAWAVERGKTALLSPFEYTPSTESNKGSFSNLATNRRPAQKGSGATRVVLIAKDWNHVALGWLALSFGWQWYLGRLLGYPECCVRAFQEKWPEARDHHHGDVARLLLVGKNPVVGPVHWGVNVFARYLKLSLISHFPCTLDCRATCLLAENQIAALNAFEPDVAPHLKAMLSSPLLFTNNEGVFVFPGADVRCEEDRFEISYDKALCLATTRQTDLAKKILEGAQITAGPESLCIGAQPLDGHLLSFDGATPLRASEETANR
jgi:hypothetical protein